MYLLAEPEETARISVHFLGRLSLDAQITNHLSQISLLAKMAGDTHNSPTPATVTACVARSLTRSIARA